MDGLERMKGFILQQKPDILFGGQVQATADRSLLANLSGRLKRRKNILSKLLIGGLELNI